MSTVRYQAYRDLKQHLGELDAVVELTELATRFLRSEAPANNTEAWYQSLCSRLGVKVSPHGASDQDQRRARIFIVALHSALERYLSELRREVSAAKQTAHWELAEGQSRLKSAIDAAGLPPIASDLISQQDVVDVLQYYREVRNNAVHSSAAEPDIPDAALDVCRFYGLCAPNAARRVSFDDVILFTRLVKDFAQALSNHLSPTIHDLIREVDLAKYSKFKNNPKRWIQAVATELRTRWSITEEMAMTAGHTVAISQGLLDQR